MLPSLEAVTNAEYGFIGIINEYGAYGTDPKKQKKVTDYSRATGASFNTEGYGSWWLRDTEFVTERGNDRYVYYIFESGAVNSTKYYRPYTQHVRADWGVVPMIRIKLVDG